MLAFVLSFAFPAVVSSSQQDAKDVWINDLAVCETGNRDVTILDSNHQYSYGPLQFQMNTWIPFGKAFGATKANIHDVMLQHVVARSMLDAGMESRWLTCARIVTKKYGVYPKGMDGS